MGGSSGSRWRGGGSGRGMSGVLDLLLMRAPLYTSQTGVWRY